MLEPVSDRLSEILEAALELSPEERQAPHELLDSVDGRLSPEERAAIDEAWAEEVERRVADAEAGRTRAEPWESVRACILEGLGR